MADDDASGLATANAAAANVTATVTVNFTGGMEGSTYIDVDGKNTKVGGEIGYFNFDNITVGSHTANGQCGNKSQSVTFTVADASPVSVNIYL
jgi:hypothetical protein